MFNHDIETRSPRACCGRGASVKSKNQAFAVKGGIAVEIAAEGFSEVEYIGSRSAGEKFTVYGYYTGTPYRVTPDKSFKVDNQDLRGGTTRNPAILEMYEGNRLMFSLATANTNGELVPDVTLSGVLETMKPTSKAIQAMGELGIITEIEPKITDELDYSILDSNLQALDLALVENEYTIEELDLLIIYEKTQGKNRTGAISRLEAKIEEIQNA